MHNVTTLNITNPHGEELVTLLVIALNDEVARQKIEQWIEGDLRLTVVVPESDAIGNDRQMKVLSMPAKMGEESIIRISGSYTHGSYADAPSLTHEMFEEMVYDASVIKTLPTLQYGLSWEDMEEVVTKAYQAFLQIKDNGVTYCAQDLERSLTGMLGAKLGNTTDAAPMVKAHAVYGAVLVEYLMLEKNFINLPIQFKDMDSPEHYGVACRDNLALLTEQMTEFFKTPFFNKKA